MSGGKPLPYAFIYGENGSGKSNLIDSLMFLKETMETVNTMNKLRNGHDASEKADLNEPRIIMTGNDLQSQQSPEINVILKNIEENLNKLSKVIPNEAPSDIGGVAEKARMVESDTGIAVSYFFTLKGHDGNYVMRFGSDNRLIYEKLSFVVESRTKDIFEISISEKNDNPSHGNSMDWKFSPQLFLKKDYGKTTEDLIRRYWGKHSFMSIMNGEYSANNAVYMDESLGTGIADVMEYFNCLIVCCDHGGGRFGKGIENKILANLAEGCVTPDRRDQLLFYEDALNSFFTRIYSDVRKAHYKIESRNGELTYTLFFSKMIGGKIREIEISKESTGTRGLLNLFPALFECACGKTVFYDELDSGIHDVLIKDIMSELKGTFKGQFIATTHNTSLLEVMDPKSIFVIQMDYMGEKMILPISRIERTQKSHNNRNRYLNGVFGGTPITGEIDFGDIVRNTAEGLRGRR